MTGGCFNFPDVPCAPGRAGTVVPRSFLPQAGRWPQTLPHKAGLPRPCTGSALGRAGQRVTRGPGPGIRYQNGAAPSPVWPAVPGPRGGCLASPPVSAHGRDRASTQPLPAARRVWSWVSQQHLGEGSPCRSPSAPQRPSGACQEELEGTDGLVKPGPGATSGGTKIIPDLAPGPAPEASSSAPTQGKLWLPPRDH